MCRKMIQEFDQIPITDEKKPRVGIVGEILVKFLPAANNYLAELLESEGAEAAKSYRGKRCHQADSQAVPSG